MDAGTGAVRAPGNIWSYIDLNHDEHRHSARCTRDVLARHL